MCRQAGEEAGRLKPLRRKVHFQGGKSELGGGKCIFRGADGGGKYKFTGELL